MKKIISILLLLVFVPSVMAFQGSKLDVTSVEVLNVDSQEIIFALTLHNKNNIDGRDISVAVYANGERHLLDFPDLNTGEKDRKIYHLPILNILGEDSMDLKLVVNNDDTRFEWSETIYLPKSEVILDTQSSSKDGKAETIEESVSLWSKMVNFLVGA
jgi:hypothetical protein